MADRKDKITIHDIARKASVSAGTVDRVIHNRTGVSQSTRTGVMKIIRQLDYQPDILARALSSRKSIKIAALYPGLKSGKTFWSIPEAGMKKAIEELSHFGVQLLKYPFDQAEPSSFLIQAKKLLKAKPDGIILAPGFSKEAKWFAKSCAELKIPFVYINSLLKTESYLSYIGQDSYASGKVAARLMNDCLGKDDLVAVINIEQDPANQVHIKEREKGFINYFVDDLRRARKHILSFTITKSTTSSINNELQKIFDKHKILGVFITNSRAYRIAQWLKTQKKYNPVLIGYDLIAENRTLLNKGMIRFLISQKPEEQGFRGVMALFNHLVLKRSVPKNQFLPIDIITAENIPYYNL
jgi:LacI family transcriptional regulator